MTQEQLDQLTQSPEFDTIYRYLGAIHAGFKITLEEFQKSKRVDEDEFCEKVSNFFIRKINKREFLDKIPEFSTFDSQVSLFCRNLYHRGYKIYFNEGGLKGLKKLFEGWLDTYGKEDGFISAIDDHSDILDAIKKYWKRDKFFDHEKESLSQLFLQKATRTEIIQWIWWQKKYGEAANITDHILFDGVEVIRRNFKKFRQAWWLELKRLDIEITEEEMMKQWMQDPLAIDKIARTKHPGIVVKEPWWWV